MIVYLRVGNSIITCRFGFYSDKFVPRCCRTCSPVFEHTAHILSTGRSSGHIILEHSQFSTVNSCLTGDGSKIKLWEKVHTGFAPICVRNTSRIFGNIAYIAIIHSLINTILRFYKRIDIHRIRQYFNGWVYLDRISAFRCGKPLVVYR